MPGGIERIKSIERQGGERAHPEAGSRARDLGALEGRKEKSRRGVARAVDWAPLTSLRGTGKEWNLILISFWPSLCESLNKTNPILGLTHVVHQHKVGSPRGEAAT